MTVPREFGVVGLGRMGGNLSLQALEKGIRVVGHDPKGPSDEMKAAGMIEAQSHADFRQHITKPRAVFVYVLAGPLVDVILDSLAKELEPGDIVVDGGNSYWGDSIARAKRLGEKGIRLVDLGTSGGVDGARRGACFMAGGDREAVARIEPMLIDLAVKDGYVHAGSSGAGHFTKLVHNGIEFAMLQAIGEGMDLLERYHDRLDVPEVLKCWRHGSVIRSWLVDLMHAQYVKQGGLDKIPSFIDDTGEVNWLVTDAIRMETPVPVIATAVMQLISSRDDEKNWARAIAMMRNGFGGHGFGPSEAVARERREGRVGDFFREKP